MKRKWNWVDTLVIILIAAAILAFFNRDRLSNGVAPSNRRSISFTVEAKKLPKDIITELSSGDQIFSQYKLQKAYITEIAVKPTEKTSVAPDGTLKVYEDTEEMILEATIEAEVLSSGPYLDLGGQEIKVGIPFILKTTDVEITSDIKHIEVKP